MSDRGMAIADVGLLVIRGSGDHARSKLQRLLKLAATKVRRKLYVHVEQRKYFKELLPFIYITASSLGTEVDFRVLVDRTRDVQVDSVFHDEMKDLEHPTFPILTQNSSGVFSLDQCEMLFEKPYQSVILGGTFDRLHNGHKLMLSEAIMLTSKELTCGITDGRMNEKKMLHELIEPLEERCKGVRDFVEDISEGIECHTIPITDAYGPSIIGNDYEAIVVSEETMRGGEAVNEKRKDLGLKQLAIHKVRLLESQEMDMILNESKISSSTRRKQLLGIELRQPILRPETETIPKGHYVIGLTGGIASGKTHIAKYLATQGCEVIDCDTLVHNLYATSIELRNELGKEFGELVVKDGNVDRKNLADIVFRDKEKLKRLDKIVWPLTLAKVSELIQVSSKQIAVIDAALLLEAGWHNYVHQIWTVFIPREEALKRICARDGVSPEKAAERLESQWDNRMRIKHSNLVFCSLWDYSETERQVQMALDRVRKHYVPIILAKAN